MKKVAAIDLGTNTFLCLIGEVEGQNLRVIKDVAKVVRLGEKVNEGKRFIPSALRRASEALDEFAKLIKENQVECVVATATSAARDVENGSDLLDLGRARNIPISVISGKREAELSFEGAISSLSDAEQKNIFVVDVGGGSTELIYRQAHDKNIRAQSFNVGCVRLTEMFLKSDPVAREELDNLKAFALQKMSEFGSSLSDLVIGVAGTPTTLAAVSQKIDFDEHKVEGYILTREHISELIRMLGAMSLEERKNVTGLEPLRADVIVAGGTLLNCALDVANKKELRVSTRGLRYGVILRYKEFL